MKQTVEIKSIFEGLMPSTLFGAPHQYLQGVGIDPDVPLTDDSSDIKTGGGIRPVSYDKFSGDEIDATPIAIINTPKNNGTWVILENGKIIVYDSNLTSAGSFYVGQVAGNAARGAFYYNNYIYITGTGSKHDDVSRIGPLNTLYYTDQSANFTVGETVTGSTSGASAIILGQYPTASRSTSASISPSTSRSPSASASRSPSPSAGFSFSASQSPSSSRSPSASASRSSSASASPSTSASPSASVSPSRYPEFAGRLTLSVVDGFFTNGEIITDGGGGQAVVSFDLTNFIENGVWTGTTLGSQSAIGDANYPESLLATKYLNHFGFTHSDGAAYFLDYKLNGLGYIHKIQTKEVDVQGDTDDGSAFGSVGALSLPFDFMPITAVSYSTDIVISGSKTIDGIVNQGNACLFFWDSAEELFYRVVTLPDPLCSTLKYVNGILYGLSGDINGGYRLWRYVGGDAIETLKIVEDGYLPLQNAADFVGNRLVWGANTTVPVNSGGLYAYGSKSDLFPRGLHHIALANFD